MKVFINNSGVSVFKGATLMDAVHSYSGRTARLLKSGYFSIFDRFGNLTETDGPVAEGQHFFIKLSKQKN